MTPPCGFDLLKSILPRRVKQLPDHHQERPNTRYALQDAALGAFGIFFTQSPSFWAYQRRLQHTQGHHNVHTLCDVEPIPCDHQGRKRLDPITPRALDAVFVEVFEGREPHRMLSHFRVLGAQLLVALDGTTSVSSEAMHGHNGLRRQLSHSPTRSYHAAITPVIVCPGHAQVIALPPEDIRPQDGPDQQVGERAVGNRWLAKHAAQVAPHGVTCLGDALSSNPPFCALVFHQGCHFICTCQSASHATRSARFAFWQATDASAEHEASHCNGRFTAGTLVRSLNAVLLRRGDDAVAGNGFAMPVVNAKTGEQRYHHRWITHHRLTADTVVVVAQSGRGRWQIANENHPVLTTKGSHLAHNFGPGEQYLSAFLLSLNLLALLFHTVLEWSDDQDAWLRQVMVRRQAFFPAIQAFMRSMVFDSWDHFMDFMIRGLELESHFDTS